MDTMEITKFVGAFCGSLLAFLLIQTAAHAVFDTSSELVAYEIEGAESTEETPEEEVDIEALMSAADPAKGETVFKKCASCHKLDGSDGVGPHLDGVIGRDIGSVEGFGYSDALTGLEGNWDAAALFHFVEKPKEFAPGTKMSFAGLPKPEDRANLIAFLEQAGG